MHIHITGASGSGTTTLGRALAQALGWRYLDADRYYWLPTSPPFQEKRAASKRQTQLQADLASEGDAVLSGSIVGWGDAVENAFGLVVFLYLPADIRVARLRCRELEKYGVADPAFLEWASQYDEGAAEGRSLARHKAWLAQRTCPVLRLEEDMPVHERVARVLAALPPRPADPTDWRLHGQERYLRGAAFAWALYQPYRPGWEHDHCEFCGAEFSLEGVDALRAGHATHDRYRWVCAQCFQDFRQLMTLRVK